MTEANAMRQNPALDIEELQDFDAVHACEALWAKGPGRTSGNAGFWLLARGEERPVARLADAAQSLVDRNHADVHGAFGFGHVALCG